MIRLFSIFLLFFCSLAFANEVKIQEFVDKFEIKKTQLQGGAIAIMKQDQVVYKSTFGYQKDKSSPIDQHTLLPLASVSKPISAVSIALLVDKGILDFNEKFHLPYIREKVSLGDLLSHTTGYYVRGDSEIEKGISRVGLFKVIKNHKPKCSPSKCYYYSNIVFSGIEDILTKKGLSFKKGIDNLQLTLKTKEIQIMPIDSGMEVAYPHKVNKISDKDYFSSLPFPPYYPKNVQSSAGVFASINAMIEFYKLSFGYKPNLISRETLNLLYKSNLSNKDIDKWGTNWPYDKNLIESYYGLGWRILKIKGSTDKDLIFHSGRINGVTTFIGYIPSKELGIIVLLNQYPSGAFRSGINFWGEITK